MDEATRRRETRTEPRRAPRPRLARGRRRAAARKAMVVLPYKDRLLLFSRYLQQLVMESLGKEKDLAGPGRPPGPRRLRQQGLDRPARLRAAAARRAPDFFVTFVRVLKDRDGREPRGRAGRDERRLPRRLPARHARARSSRTAAPRSRSRSPTSDPAEPGDADRALRAGGRASTRASSASTPTTSRASRPARRRRPSVLDLQRRVVAALRERGAGRRDVRGAGRGGRGARRGGDRLPPARAAGREPGPRASRGAPAPRPSTPSTWLARPGPDRPSGRPRGRWGRRSSCPPPRRPA